MKSEAQFSVGMRVWGPRWTELGRNNHTQYIIKRLRMLNGSDFAIPDSSLGYFIEIEGALLDKPLKNRFSNSRSRDLREFTCSFTINEEEIELPDAEFKQILSRKFLDAGSSLANYVKTHLPAFDQEAFLTRSQEIVESYLEATVSTELSLNEKRSMEFIKSRSKGNQGF